jgi:hypothetical protein
MNVYHGHWGDFMRWASAIFLIPVVCAPWLRAAQFSGSVRAADQLVPGATVTARQGETKVTAFTDENGRYSMDLAPGMWDIQVEMFEFTAATGQVQVGAAALTRNWVLNMPKVAARGGPAAGASAAPLMPIPGATAGRGRAGGRGGQGGFGGRGGQRAQGAPAATTASAGRGPAGASTAAAGRGASDTAGLLEALNGPGTQPQPGFQTAAVRQTEQGQQAAAAPEAQSAEIPQPTPDAALDDDQVFMINGSVSGGLGQSSDDETRRQQAIGGRGGPGGGGGAASAAQGLQTSAGLPPGMTATLTNDSLGLGGFGAGAINGGFDVGPTAGGRGGAAGGGLGAGGGRGGGGFGGGGGGGGFGGGGGGGGRGGGGGGGGRGGGGGGRGGLGGRGPFNGQFASFGNRRRTTPPLTGSLAINARNSALNAAPFSLNGKAVQKAYSSNDTLNANIGGPLHIPKIVNWQRAQFTVTFATTLGRNGSSMLGSVPTAAERGGDFSQAGANPPVVYDPLNGAPFPNNTIPSTRFNSASLGLLNYFPNPTFPGIVQNYSFVITNPSTSRSVGVRFNAPLNNKDRLNFNFQRQTSDSKTHQLFGFLDSSNSSSFSFSTGWSHSFAARLNNSATISTSRSVSQSTPFFANTANIAAQLGITGTSQIPLTYGPPSLSFTNFSGLSDGSASQSASRTTTFSDSFTYVAKRKHNLTFGFTYNRMEQNSLGYSNARGSFSFSGLLTSELDAAGQPVKGTGYDFADFLLGYPQSTSVRFGTSVYPRGWSTSAYAQDDFRATAALTINVGLRYEYWAPYTELRGHLANLDVSPGFTAVQVVTSGENGPYSGSLPSSIVRPMQKAFSPRFGVAWRPFKRLNTIVRTGYSIFYSGSSYAQIAGQMDLQPPFTTSASLTTSVAAPLTLQNGFPSYPNVLTNTYAIDPNFRIAYAQIWNFSLQHTLPHGLVMDTEYIGTKGTHLGVVENPNRPLGSISQQQLQIANATSFTYQTDGANSIYNAAQVRLTRRLSRSISANALYAFSKFLDDASTFSGTGGTAVEFLNNRRLERGLDSSDQRHRLTGGFQISSPVGVRGFMRSAGWRTGLLKNWNLQATFTAASGTPLTAYVSGNLANTGGLAGGGNVRAQATGLPIHASGYPYFNLAAFTTPPAGQFGNAGRNTIPGPFRTSLNSSMNRAFRFGESRRTLTLTINATNVLNHVSITGYGTTVNSASYGLPTAASGTRTVSLAMRFSF